MSDEDLLSWLKALAFDYPTREPFTDALSEKVRENATLRASLAEARERVEALEKALREVRGALRGDWLPFIDSALSRPSPQATPKPEDKFAFTLRVGDENFKKLSPDLQAQIRSILSNSWDGKPQATPKCHCAEYYPGQGHPPDCPTQKPQATAGKECCPIPCYESTVGRPCQHEPEGRGEGA